MKYYAVKLGVNPGIYTTWTECSKQVVGFKGAIYKSFETKEEAEEFMSKDKQTFDDEIDFSKMESFAFVDGSFNDNTEVYGGGYFIFHKNEKSTSFLEGMVSGEDDDLKSIKNVAGELLAAESAIVRAMFKNFKEIYIFFDYQGIESWADGTWDAHTIGTKAYKKFIEKCEDKIKIHFIKVKGHSNVMMNDYVDLLAKRACGVEVPDVTLISTKNKLFKVLGMEVIEDADK